MERRREGPRWVEENALKKRVPIILQGVCRTGSCTVAWEDVRVGRT